MWLAAPSGPFNHLHWSVGDQKTSRFGTGPTLSPLLKINLYLTAATKNWSQRDGMHSTTCINLRVSPWFEGNSYWWLNLFLEPMSQGLHEGSIPGILSATHWLSINKRIEWSILALTKDRSSGTSGKLCIYKYKSYRSFTSDVGGFSPTHLENICSTWESSRRMKVKHIWVATT